MDAERQINALAAAELLLSAYRAAKGRAAGAPVKAYSLEPNAFAFGDC